MAKRGENIYKRKDNRWEGRYIKAYASNGKPIFGYIYAKSYREVKEKLCKAKSGELRVIFSSKKNFSEYCDEWIELRKLCVKESSYVKYHVIVSNHLKPFFGELEPSEINTAFVGEFSRILSEEKDLSPKTVRDILTVLRAILIYIKKQSGGSGRDTEITYPRETQKEMRVMSTEEQKIFVSYMLSGSDNIKRGILLALMTGMRIGEICALRWTDISIEDRTVHVNRTMQRLKILDKNSEVKTKIIIGEAKSEKSNRIIPLTDSAFQLCMQMRSEDSQAYLLSGRSDCYIEPRVLQYRLAKYTEECDLDGIHFHVLRHTFATRCVEVGFEIKTLSEILGHSNTSVTLNRYVHSSMELKRSNMDKLSAIGM